MSGWKRNEHGLTLVEVAAVSVIAVVILLGFSGFYLASQFTWIDGSTKTLTQREGTLLLQTMRDKVHASYWYVVDPIEHKLSLIKPGGATFYVFEWRANDDSLMYGGQENNPQVILQSKVRRFEFAPQTDSALVTLNHLELVSATGQTVDFSSSFALLNRGKH